MEQKTTANSVSINSKAEQTLSIPSRRRALRLITGGALSALSFNNGRTIADELTNISKSKSNSFITGYEGEAYSVDLNEIDLRSKKSNELLWKLNVTLHSFIVVAKEFYGLKNVTIGENFKTEDDGSHVFKFDDPLGKLPSSVKIPALSKSVIKRDDKLHERFLMLAALEIACYHGGDKYSSYQEMTRRMNSFPTHAVNHKKNIKMIWTLKKLVDGNSHQSRKATNAELDRMVKGTTNRFSVGRNNEDSIELLTRFSSLFKRMQEDRVLNKEMTVDSLVTFARLMFTKRYTSYKFTSLDSEVKLPVYSDMKNAAKLFSFNRINKHLTDQTFPKVHGIMDDLKSLPKLIISFNAHGHGIQLSPDHLIFDSGRPAISTSRGMLAFQRTYRYRDYEKKGIEYFSDFEKLPDIGSGLTSSLFLAFGLYTSDNKKEIEAITQLANELGISMIPNENIPAMAQDKLYFGTYKPIEINRYAKKNS